MFWGHIRQINCKYIYIPGNSNIALSLRINSTNALTLGRDDSMSDGKSDDLSIDKYEVQIDDANPMVALLERAAGRGGSLRSFFYPNTRSTLYAETSGVRWGFETLDLNTRRNKKGK